jgi:DNA polymerase IIIc chi subunit
LIDENGVLKGCDHGVAFHSEDKLRTVLWQFSEQSFLPEELTLLNNVKSINLDQVFSNYLTKEEIAAISIRTDNLISNAKFPEPSNSWPAVPWPPV